MSTPQGTLVWSGSPTASQPVQPTKSPKPPTGSLSWTTSPTYSAVDDFIVPEDNRTTSERLRDVFGYTPNIKRQEEIASRYVEGKTTLPEMVGQSAMNTVGAFLAPVVKVVGKAVQGVDSVLSGKGKYNPVPERNLYTDIKKGAEQAYNKSVSTISESPIVQSYSNTENSKSFEEYVRGINDLLAITPLPKVVSGTNKALSAAEEYALQQLNKLKETHADTSLQKVVGQIEQVEKVGARSKTPYTAKDALITQKIAQSNVLPQTVDKTGTIDATKIKAAQQQYLEQPIGVQEDGSPITVRNAESVVGRLLEQEGAKANINEVINYLKSSVENSGLPADVMKRAIDRGVPVFAQALMKYADEFGNIALDKLHVEKIRTTSGLDYTKPLSKTYRKALASGLKQVIEKKSTQPIEAINQELGLHLEAVKRIGKLAGKKVEGGRLGTHVARGVGTGLGIVLGKIAGPVGATIGGAVGGEIGSAVQSAKMQRTFGKPGESTMPGSKLLEQASIEANKPKIRDLTVPDKAVGATKNIPKNKEILRIEKAIKDNVTAQKEAIKAKDFELVAKLKEVYDVLVEKLKTAIKKIKETPNKQGGFIGGSPSKSRKPLEPQKSERISSSNDTTDISNAQESLLEEAKKYETVEEFVKAQPTYYHQSQSKTAFDDFKQKGDAGYKKADYSQASEGIYFSLNKELVKSKYGKDGGALLEVSIVPKKKLDLGEYDAMYFDGRKVQYGDVVTENFKRSMRGEAELPEPDIILTGISKKAKAWLEKNGYDAVSGMEGEMFSSPELVVLDKSIIKTKSQLIDIWQKAHSGADDLVNQAKKYNTLEEFVKAQESKILQHVSDNPNLTKFEKMSEVNKVYNDKLKEFEALDKQRKSLKTFDDIEKFDDKKWLELKNWLSTNDKIKLGERGANAGEGIYLSSKPDFWRAALESEGKPMGDYTYDVLVTNPTKAKEYMQTAGGGQMLPETLIQPNEGIILGKSGEVDVTKKLTDIWNKAHSGADDLVNQAKKYATPEEFVKAQGTPLYHGSTNKWTGEFRKPTGERGSEGIFLSPSESGAKYYDRSLSGSGEVKSVFVNPKVKLWDYKNPKDVEALSAYIKSTVENTSQRTLKLKLEAQKDAIIQRAKMSEGGMQIRGEDLPKYNEIKQKLSELPDSAYNKSADELIAEIKTGAYETISDPRISSWIKQHYDGFKQMDWYDTGRAESIAIFDPKNVKTSSQLTDIWKKAHESQKEINPAMYQELLAKKDEILNNLHLSEAQKKKAIDALDEVIRLMK